MRIAIITSDGRAVTHDYASLSIGLGTAPEALLQGFATLSDLEVHVISCVQKNVTSPNKLADNIWYHSLHVPKFGWLRTGYQGCIRAVRKKLREIKPDIVHGQGTERDCAISAVLSGYPNVVTIHGNMAELAKLFSSRIGSYGWLASKLEDITLPRTAGVFCNSVYTKSLVAPRAKQTWIVPNPIRREFFKILPKATKNHRPIILNIGNISPRKRQVEILKMLQSLHKEGYDFEVRFVGVCGDDEYGISFKRILAESNSAGFASYLGSMTTEEMISAMDSADALCHFPSEEAFGLVVAEALARNLKIFAPALGGILDIAGGIEGAELFPPEEWSSMRAGISRWIKEGHPRSVVTNHIMEKRVHPRIIAENHVEIYNQVLSD